jgi:hypothetical protein
MSFWDLWRKKNYLPTYSTHFSNCVGLETVNLIFLVYVVKQGYGCKINMRKYTTYTQKILKTQIKAKVIFF